MNLRKFRKATVKKRQLLDKEVCKKKRRMLIDLNSPQSAPEYEENSSNLTLNFSTTGSHRGERACEIDTKSELLSETSNTMTLEQFTDIVLASEGMTLNNNNNSCTNSSPGGVVGATISANTTPTGINKVL